MVSLNDQLEPILGGKSAKALAAAFDIRTVHDLLRHYPRRYDERGQLTDIAGLELGEHVTVLGRVLRSDQRRLERKKVWLTKVVVTDGHRTLECAFFGPRHLSNTLRVGCSALFAGKVSIFNKKLQLTNPEFHPIDGDTEDTDIEGFIGLIPVYPA